MPPNKPPEHLRRARLAKRVQLLLALAAAGFVVYRLIALFQGKASPLH